MIFLPDSAGGVAELKHFRSMEGVTCNINTVTMVKTKTDELHDGAC